MESQLHVLQMNLLMEPLEVFWADQPEGFVGGNMFVYFSLEQIRNQDFRGPDVFVVLGVPKRLRKSWVVWEEGKGPDVVIELLSESTASIDRGKKKQIYQDQLRVPEYFWYDPFSEELAGFRLHSGIYEPIRPNERGHLVSQMLQLALVSWEGKYRETDARWLRWATLEGVVLPIKAEKEEQRAEHERQRAEHERQRAEHERQQKEAAQQQVEHEHQRAEQALRRATELESLLNEYRKRLGEGAD
jgi:Uma2 family endonuclease